MRDDEGQQQIRVLARLVDELREAVAPPTTPSRRPLLIRNVEIVYRYVHDGWSAPELAAQFQLSAVYIANILRWYHIPLTMRQHGLVMRNARIAQEVADSPRCDSWLSGMTCRRRRFGNCSSSKAFNR